MRKQAVLLIHGIGEQKPMDSLRSFVEVVWTADADQHRPHPRGGEVWSKPYELNQNFELRRLTTARNAAGLRTDFFELYWAHLMPGTGVGHLLSWGRSLLIRRPSKVPRHLRAAYWMLILLALGGLLLALRSALVEDQAALVPAWASWLLSAAALPMLGGLLKSTVGDAARYLHVAPNNVQRRHEIRAAGVAALESLHERDYERIIVVGHSLGSVIGYDVLYHAWARQNSEKPQPSARSYAELSALERLAERLEEGEDVDIGEIQDAQRRYGAEMRGNGSRWRVTDFVTLGSPLAHAEVLLARNGEELAQRLDSREMARCLPTLETRQRDGKTLRGFSYPLGEAERTPHHAAVFGPTRWTNLYFVSRFLVRGDLIGGPLRPVLGRGIRDVPLRTKQRGGFLSHTLYWKGGARDPHVAALLDALDLLDARSAVATHASGTRPSREADAH